MLSLLPCCRAMLQLASTVILIAVGAPFSLPALLLMMGLFWALYRYFIASMRQAKRLEAVSRWGPVHYCCAAAECKCTPMTQISCFVDCRFVTHAHTESLLAVRGACGRCCVLS
jgi:hypothetical protein